MQFDIGFLFPFIFRWISQYSFSSAASSSCCHYCRPGRWVSFYPFLSPFPPSPTLQMEDTSWNPNLNTTPSLETLQGFCCSVTPSCLTHCDPMDCSAPGFPVLHHLLELAQTHVHRVGNAIQPSHPLFPPFPPAFDLSQHQGLFQ